MRIEGEVLDVDVARGHEDAARLPMSQSSVRKRDSNILEVLHHILGPETRTRQSGSIPTPGDAEGETRPACLRIERSIVEEFE